MTTNSNTLVREPSHCGHGDEIPDLRSRAHAAPTPAHVLVVEDDPDGLALCVRHLRSYGFAVSTAETGAAALEQARSARPNAVLLDLGLPDMDGMEILSSLKTDPLTRPIPVLLLTARDDTESKVHGFDLGASDYLTKPIAEAELRARLSLHLRQQSLLDTLEQRVRQYRDHFGEVDAAVEDAAQRYDLPRQEVARLFEVRRLIMTRLADPPSLDELADAVGTNQPRLSKGFRTLFGTTVFGYLRALRMQRARELLQGTCLPIKTIAAQIGYRSTGDLTRAVREHYGTTPTALRHQASGPVQADAAKETALANGT